MANSGARHSEVSSTHMAAGCLLVILGAIAPPAPAANVTTSGNSPAPLLAQRIRHLRPQMLEHLEHVHGGAGSMEFAPLLGADALSTNLIFVHQGVINPHSGIGEHFHNRCEEMFMILDGEAQFTIAGHTSVLKGPALVPDRLGHAHGIYTAGDRPIRWMNINVGLTKIYDSFILDDPRTEVTVEPIPQFISGRLDPSQLKTHGTVKKRHEVGPSVLATAWSYVDHVILPAGTSIGPDTQEEISNVCIVLA